MVRILRLPNDTKGFSYIIMRYHECVGVCVCVCVSHVLCCTHMIMVKGSLG